jgi:hypothetical protein
MNMAAKRIHLMNTTQARPSLSSLRDKTDRQLVVLAGREIDRSLDLASRGAFAEAEAMQLQAETLLGIARAPDWKRRIIEARLERARAAIERARRVPATFTQAACF